MSVSSGAPFSFTLPDGSDKAQFVATFLRPALSSINTNAAHKSTAQTFTKKQTIALGAITADDNALELTATWNAGAVAFGGLLKVNVTDTASAAGSLLADLQVGGASKWKVDKAGAVTQQGALTIAADLTLTGANRRIIPGTVDFAITNNANTANNLLISDAGAVTIRSTLTVSGTGTSSFAGAVDITAGGLRVRGGATEPGASVGTTGASGILSGQDSASDVNYQVWTGATRRLLFGITGIVATIAGVTAQVAVDPEFVIGSTVQGFIDASDSGRLIWGGGLRAAGGITVQTGGIDVTASPAQNAIRVAIGGAGSTSRVLDFVNADAHTPEQTMQIRWRSQGPYDIAYFHVHEQASFGGAISFHTKAASASTADNPVERLRLTSSGQAQLPTTGSAAGLLIGGDVQLYRSAADALTVPDRVIFSGAFNHEFNGASTVNLGAFVSRATTNPTNGLNIFDGTAPVGTLAAGITLYSTAGELRVMDSGGTATLLSPHDNAGNWIFDSLRADGTRLRVHMEKLVKRLEEMFGWGFVEELAAA